MARKPCELKLRDKVKVIKVGALSANNHYIGKEFYWVGEHNGYKNTCAVTLERALRKDPTYKFNRKELCLVERHGS